jgi:hypothetical protein
VPCQTADCKQRREEQKEHKLKQRPLNLRGVSKKFGEWHQKTNKTEDTNKLTLLAFKIIAILHSTLLATFIKLLETVNSAIVHFSDGTRNVP